ncbi:MAG TPA: hypothetical protein VGQ57_05815, partial [Polyangiaceae bacterium]|nr:hypothetical protein [Polyangiaceae bacterium]
MPTRHVPPFLCFLGLGLLAGCESTTVTVTSVYHPTLIRVSPDGFLGNVPCRPGALGAMQTYVATIYDVGEDFAPAEPFALPSSGPVSCMNAVSFSRVIEPHRYHAEIQGYDRDDLLPLGSDDPETTLGIPILVDPVTRQAVAPRWTTSCGEETPVTARTAVERTIGNCKPLVDSGNLGPAVVEIGI